MTILNTKELPLTLLAPGFFRYLQHRGGGIKSTRWFFEPSGDLNSRPNQSNKVSDDRLDLYLPVETLKPPSPPQPQI